MTWQILTPGATDADLASLSAQDRAAVLEELLDWVPNGPPLTARRLAGAELFEDRMSCGYTVTYLANRERRYAAVVRVRRTDDRDRQ